MTQSDLRWLSYWRREPVFAVKESLIRKLENSTDPKDGTNCKTLEFNIVMQNN